VGPHPISLPFTIIEAVENVKHLLMNKLHWFTGLISLACDQSFNTCLGGRGNPSVLNRHRRGYNLGAAEFPYYSPRPSQPTVIRFPLRVPPSLQLNNLKCKPDEQLYKDLHQSSGLRTTLFLPNTTTTPINANAI
jgi:hypothetical protein